jgi:hypothetical protein
VTPHARKLLPREHGDVEIDRRHRLVAQPVEGEQIVEQLVQGAGVAAHDLQQTLAVLLRAVVARLVHRGGETVDGARRPAQIAGDRPGERLQVGRAFSGSALHLPGLLRDLGMEPGMEDRQGERRGDHIPGHSGRER